MEENENQNVEPEVSTESKESKVSKVLEVLKANKKKIIIVVVAIIAILIVVDLLFISPKEAAKKYLTNLKAAHSKKADKYFNYAGAQALSNVGDDYDDFWEEYKEYKSSDDWEEYKETLDEKFDDDYYEDMDESIKDSDVTVKIKKVTKVKKLGSHLYRVSLQVQTKDEDGDKETNTMKLLVMKEGLKSYVVGYDY